MIKRGQKEEGPGIAGVIMRSRRGEAGSQKQGFFGFSSQDPRLSVLFLTIITLISGCRPTQRAPRPVPYTGPTESMGQVIEQINANNLPLRSLWAQHDFEAAIVDDKGKMHTVLGDGVLMHRKPHDLSLRGNRPGMTIFELGSTSERFWLKLVPEMDTMWWGQYRNLGKPCTQEIPIRPDLILEVLGIGDIDTDFSNQPAPTMRFNNDQDAYMFIWNVKLPDRWIAQKEIWYDRQTKRPRLVLLFDEDGRVVLRGYLSEFQPVEVADLPSDRRPVVATRYDLFFPGNKSKIDLRLRDVRSMYRGAPNDRSFRFPAEPGVSRVIQIDENCE